MDPVIASPLSLIRWRLAQLAAHLVVALIALVVIGGATRVMEAGLACPDWPLCYGSFLPGRQMNVQVFLEWFHRLDAFLVGIALLGQLFFALIWRKNLPKWLVRAYVMLVFLVALQGGLGALTVLQLLPSAVVTAHLGCALTLLAILSGLSQRLLLTKPIESPVWWRLMAGGSLIAVMVQCLIGGRMATAWAAKRCLFNGQDCIWLDLHRMSAVLVAACVLTFVLTSLFVGGWPRSQWPYLLALFLLVATQMTLGILSLKFGLQQPLLTVTHQLIAALLVALLAALSFRSPQNSLPDLSEIGNGNDLSLEPCNG